MLKSYFIVALRNLLKSKVYSLINITGLAIGLACALAIGIFLADEFSYDRFHDRADHIYRVVQTQDQNGELYQVASSPAPMADALRADFSEVIGSCLVGYNRTGVLQAGGTTIEVPHITVANQGFLDVFDFELIRGNANELFTDPRQIVISDKTAESLFGRDWRSRHDILGSTIAVQKNREFSLAGILREAPENSHIQYDAILAFDPAGDGNTNWFSNNYHTYIELAEGASTSDLNEKLATYIDRYSNPTTRTFKSPAFYLQPLTDIYLHSDFDFHTDWTKTSSIIYVRVFLAVGAVVLLIAIFNFINLSTARAIRRAKEVGVRKTIGAYYGQLVAQFLFESLLITAMSVTLALGLVEVSLPFLNNITEKSLSLPLSEPLFLLELFTFTLIVSLLAGAYPAIYLSNFQPVKVLKGVLQIGSGRRFRQALVVTQFTLTIILVGATIVIFRQLSYMKEKDLGFDKEALIYLSIGEMDQKDRLRLWDELRELGSVRSASLASNSLIDNVNSTSYFDYEGRTEGDGFLMTRINTDPAYIGTMGMQLVEGRNFDVARKSDSAAFIVNRTAAKRMGWTPQEALGKTFKLHDVSGQIIGVLEDFHFRPMTAAIEPAVLSFQSKGWYSGILIKAGDTGKSIGDIEAVYKKYEPNTPAHYNFVDDQLDRQYKLQQTTGTLVMFFSLLAIFVACLGLYGLAAFTAERRTKEIGIRKALGASVGSVSMLLSRDFVSLVLISIIVACPIAYKLMDGWLQNFVYRVEMDWKFLAVAGLLALSVAVITVLYQAVAVARKNPVHSLRTE